MAYDVKENISNKSGSKLADNGDLTFTAERSWTISNTVVGQSGETVKAALQASGGLPKNGNQHPDNEVLTAVDVKCVRVSPIYFTATATYKSPPIPHGDWEGGGDPFDLSTTVKWRSVRSMSEVDEDYDGAPIENPGTKEQVKGVMRAVTDWKAVLTKNVPVFSPPNFQQYFDNVNSDNFLGFPPGMALLISAQADDAVLNDVAYFVLTAEVLFKTNYRVTTDKSWYHRRILKGFLEVDQSLPGVGDELVVHAVDAVKGERHPVSSPILLDGFGIRLEDGVDPVPAETKLYGSVAYSGMGF